MHYDEVVEHLGEPDDFGFGNRTTFPRFVRYERLELHFEETGELYLLYSETIDGVTTFNISVTSFRES